MARHKKFRKADFIELEGCFKDDKSWKGKWREWYGNENPLYLEVGCGKGELTLGMCRQFPDRNFMGIDLKSDRLWVAAQSKIEENLKNVAFHRIDVLELSDYFAPGEVSGIWITFPDPFPKKKYTRYRLPHSRYLEEYKKVLKPEGRVQFKTDNEALFDWTLEHFEEIGIQPGGITRDLHHSEFLNEETGIITHYENRFLKMGEKIHYLYFNFDPG